LASVVAGTLPTLKISRTTGTAQHRLYLSRKTKPLFMLLSACAFQLDLFAPAATHIPILVDCEQRKGTIRSSRARIGPFSRAPPPGIERRRLLACPLRIQLLVVRALSQRPCVCCCCTPLFTCTSGHGCTAADMWPGHGSTLPDFEFVSVPISRYFVLYFVFQEEDVKNDAQDCGLRSRGCWLCCCP
jgi:hypothetical protein